MASPGHEYTLVGFSEEVDRRPLVFFEPLPSAKVCSACGIVAKAIAQHECGHYFCKACYEQCLRRGEVVCPFDGDGCLEDEITWVRGRTQTVMTKKMLCWNHRNGCNVVTAAADISRHFHHSPWKTSRLTTNHEESPPSAESTSEARHILQVLFQGTKQHLATVKSINVPDGRSEMSK